MSKKVKQPYKDIREHLKDSNFNNVVMEAFDLMCGETVEMDLQFDNYPMAHTKYRETEASKKSIEFSKKYHGTSVVGRAIYFDPETVEVFDEPKELKDFKVYDKSYDNVGAFGWAFSEDEKYCPLKRAPKNYIYVEVEK